MSTRLCVIGARGYYGRVVSAALAKLPDVVVTGASRSGEPKVDLNDPSTFAALDGFDAIVNCSDTVGAPPEALARDCLARGRVLFEMGAETGETRRILSLDGTGARGTVVAGVGVFPGYSTVLAASVAAAGCDTLELGIRLSPFSGAGSGNCRLMTRFLDTPSLRFEGGERVEGAPLGPAQRLTYLTVGTRPGPLVAMPDTELMHRATGVPTVATYLALAPSFLRHNFALLTKLYAWAGPLRPVLRKTTEWSLLAMRALLLRGLSSAVQLSALADRGRASERALMVSFPDGQAATACGVAAAVGLWIDGARPAQPGVYTTADLFALEPLTERMRALGCEVERG